MIECNADKGHPCDADDGAPCPRCQETIAYWHAYYGGLSRSQLAAMDPRRPENIEPDEFGDEWKTWRNP